MARGVDRGVGTERGGGHLESLPCPGGRRRGRLGRGGGGFPWGMGEPQK